MEKEKKGSFKLFTDEYCLGCISKLLYFINRKLDELYNDCTVDDIGRLTISLGQLIDMRERILKKQETIGSINCAMTEENF